MTKPLFDKVLIANRGEIAIRIAKTLKKMGIKSVAVYSESDINSLHVQAADEAFYIGNSPSTESYLSIKNIMNAVRLSGAQAVHPAYGFLSENANFAATLKSEGVQLIGPSPSAIKSMGDKIEAKKLAVEAGVSTVPGYMGIIENSDKALEIAREIGYPVIVKAAAGGGGRGMRVVRNDSEMKSAFESATLEAQNSFSDGRVFIEKCIEKPRHIEIQLLSDKFGNAVCLGERECSIQRHHQKVIEEAPSSFIDQETREKMYAEVIALSKRVGYYSAGTVEFIVDPDKNFYFMEMNTRLQVEHCVTEMITGIDIVEEMVKIAAGLPLSFTQKDIILNGWAIEARIYAEDPQRGFLPSSGRITEYSEPVKSSSIRIDSGVTGGGEVSMFYDPMIAKLCTYGHDRDEALSVMQNALSTFIIKGISHNISFLEAIMRHPRFMSGDINTGFIAEEYPGGFVNIGLSDEVMQTFLCTSIFIHLAEEIRNSAIDSRLCTDNYLLSTRWVVYIDDVLYPVIIKPVPHGYNIRQGSQKLNIRSSWTLGSKLFTGLINGRKVHVKIDKKGTSYVLTHLGITSSVVVRSPKQAELESIMPKSKIQEVDPEVKAQLAGKIIAVKVETGDSVTQGQQLVVLSAMKMENIVLSPQNGKILKVHIKAGDNVASGQVMMEFA